MGSTSEILITVHELILGFTWWGKEKKRLGEPGHCKLTEQPRSTSIPQVWLQREEGRCPWRPGGSTQIPHLRDWQWLPQLTNLFPGVYGSRSVICRGYCNNTSSHGGFFFCTPVKTSFGWTLTQPRICFLAIPVFFQEIFHLCDGTESMKTWLRWLSWPETYRSKKYGERNVKNILFLIMTIMTFLFAKLGGNKLIIFQNLAKVAS